MLRKIEIEKSKAKKLLEVKYDNSVEVRKCIKKMKKAEEKYKSFVSKTERADERVRPELIRIKDKLDLEEYEQVSRVYKDEKDGLWYFEISDRMEEFKKRFKEDEEKQEDEKQAKKDGDKEDK